MPLCDSLQQKKYWKLVANDGRWQSIVRHIQSQIPTICYFPTFLFEFPSRVYLSHTPEQYEPQNKYYQQIIQDVLDSLERGLTIKDHIVDRVEKTDEGCSWDLFTFFQSDRKKQVDAVMNRLGSQITSTFFTRWNEIFGAKFTKDIKIEWGVDKDQQNPPVYLSFSVQDGPSTYSIAERSLGFRWFFCFLLFTQFRKSRRDSGTLFLLDEPASNLHATAQQQLLESFKAVTEGDNSLIYSTHSHYMINPRWLEGAFIVQNGAIKYDEKISSRHEYQVHETNIKITPYKRFVGENPDKSTYYQPILDALDYKPAALEHQTGTVMVEGKGDFYILAYFMKVVFKRFDRLRFMPSSGANDIGPLISLYLGWSYDFCVLLDDDSAGKKAKMRYINEWFLDEATVFAIGDVDSRFKKMKIEGLITKDGKQQIAAALGVTRVTKKQISHYFQELLARDEKVEFDKGTNDNFKAIFEYCEKAFGRSSGT